MRGRTAVAITLRDEERTEPEVRARRRKTARADAQRAAILLLTSAGESNTAIAALLGVTRVTVTTWHIRFAKRRLQGLSDEPRPGAPRDGRPSCAPTDHVRSIEGAFEHSLVRLRDDSLAPTCVRNGRERRRGQGGSAPQAWMP